MRPQQENPQKCHLPRNMLLTSRRPKPNASRMLAKYRSINQEDKRKERRSNARRMACRTFQEALGAGEVDVGRPLRVDGVEHLLGEPRHELPAHRPHRVPPPPREERRPRGVIVPAAPVRLHAPRTAARVEAAASAPPPPSLCRFDRPLRRFLFLAPRLPLPSPGPKPGLACLRAALCLCGLCGAAAIISGKRTVYGRDRRNGCMRLRNRRLGSRH